MPDSRVADYVRLGYKHPKVQRLRRLISRREARDAEGVFVAEGFKLLEDGLKAGVRPESLFVAPDTTHEAVELARATNVPVYVFEPHVIERVSDTVSPQGVITTFPFVDAELNSTQPPLVVLVDVRDPGNVGTIMRSAEASGLGAVVLSKGSADVYSPKVVRASAGSIFNIAFVRDAETSDLLSWLEQNNIVSVATAMSGGAVYDQCDLTRGVALFLGNEANGLDEATMNAVKETVSIPMAGRAESLNVSMAASILSFEYARQMRLQS